METKSTIKAIPLILDKIQKTLGGSIISGHGSNILYPDPNLGQGYFRYTPLQKGISVIDIDFEPEKDVFLQLSSDTNDLLIFFFSISGQSSHQFEIADIKPYLEPHKPLLVHYPQNVSGELGLLRGESIQMNIIFMHKNLNTDSDEKPNAFAQSIYNSTKHIGDTIKYYYEGSYNPKISTQVALLMSDSSSNELSNALLYMGRYYVILAQHIEQFLIANNGNTSGLLKKELKSINMLSELIKDAPELPHSIHSLCMESGLSPAKLQEGFKFMFERTVTDYVRYIRLQKAEYLIRTTDMTISEVVYTIGLTSRSYFCKIFRNEYGCSPTSYKKSLGSSQQQQRIIQKG